MLKKLNNMKNFKIFSTLLFLLLISSMTFAQVKGSGKVEKDDSRNIGDFTKIHVATGIDGFVKIGNENKVVLEADDNILKHIKTEVKDGELKVSLDKYAKKATTLKAYITVKKIEGLKATSGADLVVEGIITGDKLVAKVSSGADMIFSADVNVFDGNASSGADMEIGKLIAKKANIKTSSGSDIEIDNGEVEDLNANSSSSGDIEAYGLTVQHCNAKVSSGSDINIHVVQSLNANASSGGEVSYKGDPQVEKRKSSGGSISRR